MNRRFLPLRRPFSLAFWGLAIVLIVCLTVRLYRRAAPLETGMQWRDATVATPAADEKEPSPAEPVN